MIKVDQKTLDRFWSCVDRSNEAGCWIWNGRRKKGSGIPLFNLTKSRTVNPAKFAFELLVEPVPAFKQIRKSCNNLLCCNPSHVIRYEDHAAHFWSMVAIASPTECWNFKGQCPDGAMPQWNPRDSGLSGYMTRAAYELTFGTIPEDKRVQHTCGNLKCLNPNHLVLSSDVAARFWSKVDKTPGLGPNGDCWEWLDHIKKTGYGEFRPDSKSRVPAHRFAYELFNGKIPKGWHCCHVCDNRRCTRPDHLFAGTAKDNIHDMISKGRARFPIPPRKIGSEANSSKLTDSKVSTIKELIKQGYNDCELGRRYGVSSSAIRSIRKGWTWKHVN